MKTSMNKERMEHLQALEQTALKGLKKKKYALIATVQCDFIQIKKSTELKIKCQEEQSSNHRTSTEGTEENWNSGILPKTSKG